MKLFLSILVTLSFAFYAFGDVRTISLLSGATNTGASTLTILGAPAKKTCQAYGTTGAGAGTAVVTLQVSNDGSNWFSLTDTLDLSLTTSGDIDGVEMNSLWRELRANVTTLSGTTASVSVDCAYEYPGKK